MTKPFDYQKEDTLAVERFGGRALLAHEPGLGKSLMSLLWARRNPEVRPIVIVCPASVKWNWQRECSVHFGMLSEVLEGRKPETGGLHTQSIFIINYDILGAWLEFLQSIQPQLVILDEVHYCANQRAIRTKKVRQLCRGVPHVLGLSGTPLTNRPCELWPILNIIRPDKYPSFGGFAARHCPGRITPWGIDYSGAKDLDILHLRLKKDLMIRRLKSEVLSELPPKRRVIVPLSIERPKEYQKAASDFIGWLAKQSLAKARKAQNAEALVKIGYLKRLAAALKLKSVFNWVDDFFAESDEKLVLFAVHTDVIKQLEKRYHGKCVVVNGEMTGQDRQRAVDAFQKSPKIKLFIGNIKAAGVGITLTAASTVAFAELGWTPGEMVQAEDRCHRIGQLNSLTCHYLIGKGTIEERLCSLIQSKMAVLDQVLDGSVNGEASLNIFDLLLKSLAEENS